MQVTLTLEAPEGATHYIVRHDGKVEWYMETPAGNPWVYYSGSDRSWRACGPVRNGISKTPISISENLPTTGSAAAPSKVEPNPDYLRRLCVVVEALTIIQANQCGGLQLDKDTIDWYGDAVDTVTREAGDILNGVSITFTDESA